MENRGHVTPPVGRPGVDEVVDPILLQDVLLRLRTSSGVVVGFAPRPGPPHVEEAVLPVGVGLVVPKVVHEVVTGVDTIPPW